MKNLKFILSILSLTIHYNIQSSYEDRGALRSQEPLTKINSASTTQHVEKSTSEDLSHPHSEHTSQSSNIFTKMYYGTTKHIFHQTAYGIYTELLRNGTLKSDYQFDKNEAFNRFNNAAWERFTTKNLLKADQQAKIVNLLQSALEIDSEFALAKALAAQYYILQKQALEQTLEKQALEIEPALRKTRNDIIKQAEENYIASLQEALQHAKNAAYNSRYLYEKSEETTPYSNHNICHFDTIESLSKLWRIFNKDIPVANEANLYHLPNNCYN